METTQEKIAVMKAFADGREIECRNKRSGSEWRAESSPDWNWQYYEYRIKPSAPRTWEDFCEQHNRVLDEYYIDGSASDICHAYHTEMVRRAVEDANLLKTKVDAEGLIALIKLKRLRDAWWGDWKPNYFDSRSEKFYICKECCSVDYGSLEVYKCFRYPHFLAFETKEMAEDFIECFNDLIEKAEMWL